MPSAGSPEARVREIVRHNLITSANLIDSEVARIYAEIGKVLASDPAAAQAQLPREMSALQRLLLSWRVIRDDLARLIEELEQ